MKKIVILLLWSFMGCKTTFKSDVNETFRYDKFEFMNNADSDAFKLSGFIYNSDGSPSTGNFNFENQYPVHRFKTKNGYETAIMTQSSPIHRTDSTGYFSFDFINVEEVRLTFGLCCREIIKPELGKHLDVVIYLNNELMQN